MEFKLKIIIDTSSLLSLVRYYFPFDKDSVMFNYFKAKIENKEIIIIDKVFDECKRVSGGIVESEFKNKNFAFSPNFVVKTDNILIPQPTKFYNLLENNWTFRERRNKINNNEYENSKYEFLNSADMKMILLGLILKDKKNQVIIVTEESSINNDNKLFNKIPNICNDLELATTTLPQLLLNLNEINIDYNLKNSK